MASTHPGNSASCGPVSSGGDGRFPSRNQTTEHGTKVTRTPASVRGEPQIARFLGFGRSSDFPSLRPRREGGKTSRSRSSRSLRHPWAVRLEYASDPAEDIHRHYKKSLPSIPICPERSSSTTMGPRIPIPSTHSPILDAPHKTPSPALSTTAQTPH